MEKKTRSEIMKAIWKKGERRNNFKEMNHYGENNSMYGKHLTKAHKKKLSEKFSGENNPRYGVKLSDKTKDKIRQKALGRKASETTKQKMSNKRKGKPSNRKGRTYEEIFGIEKSIEIKKELSKKLKGRIFTKDHKTRISKTRKKLLKTGEIVIHYNRLKWAKSIKMKPNKKEIFLQELLNKYFPNEWKFVGDFTFILGGKSPDFLNCNGENKLIELYGDYFHKGEDPQERIDYFKQFGFDTLVIWERELKDTDKVVERVKNFLS